MELVRRIEWRGDLRSRVGGLSRPVRRGPYHSAGSSILCSGAFEVQEGYTRRKKDKVDLPIEEAIRPPWIWDGWANPKVSDTYDIEVRNTIDRLLSVFTPVVTLFLAVLIGTIVMSVLVAILSINDLVG